MNVKEYQGQTELFLFLNEFLSSYSNYELNSIENGYLVDIHSLPYQFQFSCYPMIGWNVFLISKQEELLEDEKTSLLYEKMEDYIDQLNFQYYDLLPEEQSIIQQRLETIE